MEGGITPPKLTKRQRKYERRVRGGGPNAMVRRSLGKGKLHRFVSSPGVSYFGAPPEYRNLNPGGMIPRIVKVKRGIPLVRS